MSNKPSKKKVVVSTTSKDTDRSPATARTRSTNTTSQRALTFSRDTYLWMAIGFALVLVGMVLMSGGHMPSADVWDEDIIYSFRRTVLAPIVILSGLVVAVFAIFKK